MIPTAYPVSELVTKLTESFQGRTNVEGILKALCKPIDSIDTATLAVLQARLLDSAADDALDQLGGLVGESRNGRGDADYRAAIRLRIRINRSYGRATDMVEIANLLIGSGVKYQEGEEASYSISTYFLTGGVFGILSTLKDARPVGVYGIFRYSTWTTAINLVRGSTYASGYSNKVRNSTYGGVSLPGVRVVSEAIR